MDSDKGHSTEPFSPQHAPPRYQSVCVPVEGLHVGEEVRRKHIRRRRFWHFTACAALLLLFWRPIVYNVARFVSKLTTKHWDPDDLCQLPLRPQPMPRLSDCESVLDWTTDPGRDDGWFRAHTTLRLPVDAEELFFLSRGNFAHGVFVVDHSGDSSDDAVAIVGIEYARSAEGVLGNTTVCYLHPSEGQHGLGIFTPLWPSDGLKNRLEFSITLRLPTPASNEVLAINKLKTHLPLFVHHLPDLSRTAIFKYLSLTSTNSPLTVEAISADSATLTTVNGVIEGTFTTNHSLELITSNAPIKAEVHLINTDERNGTRLRMSTKNGGIKASVALNPDDLETPGGAFSVDARTYNAPIDLVFTDAPANSLLNASAVSSNSPVRVAAHPAFEGTFELHSSWFTPPSVVHNGPVEDPLGRGRKRNVLVNTVRRGAVRGQVGWEPQHRDAKNGHIGLETSNSPATLVL
ncbi:hypothetical protein PYCCODRAFT_1427836 [Trametes coccinea BRFM310]|uniref:Uncharacterized protein n=1 Tax=Trametes coccinea (strain BRFM310) TaxID=1353009 RepID=A0A1Y2ICN0_TRAC3|nr:hypothetical protein PYCCODRAFT_1427836 [Trametes coccinea BRFM310]